MGWTGLGRLAMACAVFGVLAACSETSIYRTDYLDGGKSIITDAKQRVVTNNKGNVYWGKNNPRRIVCAEPSPDVAQALSSAISASFAGAAQGRGSVNAELAASVSQGVTQLGERLATVQLLRDGFYRACEAYANGAISETTYSLIVSGVDETMVALLTSEMAAGAFGRELASIGGSAGAATGIIAGDQRVIESLQTSKQTLVGDVAEAESQVESAELKEANDCADLTSQQCRNAQTDLSTKRALLAKKKAQLEEVERMLIDAKAGLALSHAVANAGGGGGIGRVGADNARYVAKINTNFANRDRISALIVACISALDRSGIAHAHDRHGTDLDRTDATEDYSRVDGPRTSALSEVCYRLMKPDKKGQSLLAVMVHQGVKHEEEMARIDSKTEIAQAYLKACGTAGNTSEACRFVKLSLAR